MTTVVEFKKKKPKRTSKPKEKVVVKKKLKPEWKPEDMKDVPHNIDTEKELVNEIIEDSEEKEKPQKPLRRKLN